MNTKNFIKDTKSCPTPATLWTSMINQNPQKIKSKNSKKKTKEPWFPMTKRAKI